MKQGYGSEAIELVPKRGHAGNKQLNREGYLHQLVHAAWQLAQAALWSNYIFSEREVREAKRLIGDYLAGAEDSYQAYVAFGERALLARYYVQERAGRYVPLPTVWLSPDNDKGFRGTEAWHRRVVEVRRSLPIYKIELKAAAEGVLEMVEQPTVANFAYWRHYFAERRAADLLGVWLGAVAGGVVNGQW